MEYITFNQKQLEYQLKEQITFLKTIYPFLEKEGYNQECIEIRPIERQSKKYVRSSNLWRADAEGIQRYKEFLESINGQAVCLYYSGYTFDYNKETFKENGKKNIKGTINNQNTLYTQILPMDFDNIEDGKHQEQIEILNNLGIEVITIFTGHGFQDVILLNNPVKDQDLFKKFTYLMLSRGFSVDESIIDPARILRMPFSFNCKAFDKNSKHYDEDDPVAIPTTILNFTEKRYDVEEIFKKISSLEIKDESYLIDFEIKAQISPETTSEIESNTNYLNQKTEPTQGNMELISIEKEYHVVKFHQLPEAIQKMLICTPDGYRNAVMLFLIPFLRNKIGVSKDKIKELMIVWGNRCKPRIDPDTVISEVERIYHYDYKGTGKYTTELSKKFGFIEFEEYKKGNKVKIYNDVFYKYCCISHTAIRMYLMMKLFETTKGIKEWTKEDILKVSKLKERTFYNNIDDLVKSGLINKRRSAKKNGEAYIYYISIYLDRSKGYTEFEPSQLRMMIYDSEKELTNTEMALYTYILMMVNNNSNNSCYPSQKYLGEQIGASRSTITNNIKSLCNKEYIEKETYIKDCIEHCKYTLIF